jgi:hypothetical protein
MWSVGVVAKLRKAAFGFVMSVCLSVYLSAWNDSAPSAHVFMKFGIWVFFKKLPRKFKYH